MLLPFDKSKPKDSKILWLKAIWIYTNNPGPTIGPEARLWTHFSKIKTSVSTFSFCSPCTLHLSKMFFFRSLPTQSNFSLPNVSLFMGRVIGAVKIGYKGKENHYYHHHPPPREIVTNNPSPFFVFQARRWYTCPMSKSTMMFLLWSRPSPPHQYVPSSLVRLNQSHTPDSTLNLYVLS